MGIANKSILFGGAGGHGMGTPWGTLGEVAGAALEPLGYSLTIESRSYSTNNPKFVSDGRVDFGATRLVRIGQAYRGDGSFAEEGARDNLRVFAAINQPGWLAVAVRAESGITDLSGIRERRLPARVYDASPAWVSRLLWTHHGLDREQIERWGGSFIKHRLAVGDGVPYTHGEWARMGNFDVIIDSIYASYTPEIIHWHEAAMLHNLRFLPMPEEIVGEISAGIGGTPGYLPHHLFRGLTGSVRAAERGPQAYYGRADTDEEFVYTFCKALDENRHRFRQVHLPFSYDSSNVADSEGVPLHAGAERYYRERGYLP